MQRRRRRGASVDALVNSGRGCDRTAFQLRSNSEEMLRLGRIGGFQKDRKSGVLGFHLECVISAE
jgi:hypothetical protein